MFRPWLTAPCCVIDGERIIRHPAHVHHLFIECAHTLVLHNQFIPRWDTTTLSTNNFPVISRSLREK